MSIPTERQIQYIKKAFHIKKGYSGIDVALDSSKFCCYFNHIPIEELRQKVEYVLSTEFGEDKYTWRYKYDEYGDKMGACAHHITLDKK
jgi:hypothetical protein